MHADLWTARPLLAIASLAPVFLGVLWMAWAPALVRRFAPGRGTATAWLTWAGTRPLFALLVVGLLGHLSSDMTGFYLPQAQAVARGAVIYRDFRSSYAPLFPAWLALSLLAGPIGPTLLFLAADLVTWRLLARADAGRGRGPLDGAGWAYLACPAVWYFTVRYSQDEALAAVFLAAAILAAWRGREGRAGLLLGLGLLSTKALFGLPLLAFPLAARRLRWRAVLGFAVPVAAVYGALLALHAPILQPLAIEGRSFGEGPSIWFVPRLFLHAQPGRWGQLPFLLVFLAGALVLRRRGATLLQQGLWGYLSLALLGAKFLPMYVVMWAPWIALWVAEGGAGRRRWWWATGTLLALGWVIEMGPLTGLLGPGPFVVAFLLMLAMPVLHLLATVALWREAGRDAGSAILEPVAVR